MHIVNLEVSVNLCKINKVPYIECDQFELAIHIGRTLIDEFLYIKVFPLCLDQPHLLPNRLISHKLMSNYHFVALIMHGLNEESCEVVISKNQVHLHVRLAKSTQLVNKGVMNKDDTNH